MRAVVVLVLAAAIAGGWFAHTYGRPEETIPAAVFAAGACLLVCGLLLIRSQLRKAGRRR